MEKSLRRESPVKEKIDYMCQLVRGMSNHHGGGAGGVSREGKRSIMSRERGFRDVISLPLITIGEETDVSRMAPKVNH